MARGVTNCFVERRSCEFHNCWVGCIALEFAPIFGRRQRFTCCKCVVFDDVTVLPGPAFWSQAAWMGTVMSSGDDVLRRAPMQ